MYSKKIDSCYKKLNKYYKNNDVVYKSNHNFIINKI